MIGHETESGLIDRAVRARHHGLTGEFERCHALLATPAGSADVQRVNRALLASLGSEVASAWQRGWQPAELVRVASREFGVRHGRVVADAVVSRMRDHPAATVDHRWRAQVEALGTAVWWAHDDHYVTSFGVREKVDRASVIALVVEVLHLLATLPVIATVVPAPGDGSASAPLGELDQRTLDRVRALLAKAESTDFPEEADACTAKAQELMARHRIDQALLTAARGEPGGPATRRMSIDNPYETPKTLLLQVVAEANRCRAVWMKRFGFSTVVGFPTDIDATELLFTSLLVQATRAMTQTSPTVDAYGRNTTRSFRQSFLTAYASRIGERLNAASDEVETAQARQASDLLPVLAARDDAVRLAVEEQFPEVTRRTTTVSNSSGWVSGRAAADRASLSGRRAVAR